MSFNLTVSGHIEGDGASDKEHEIRNAFAEVVERFKDEVSTASFYGQFTSSANLVVQAEGQVVTGDDDNPNTEDPNPSTAAGPGSVGKEA